MNPDQAVPRAVALIVLDGWGHADPGPGNAISLADTPFYDGLKARFPCVLLDASGRAVGLPDGVMGNSEVGHLTLGSGRIIYQDLSRINRAIEDGSFFRNEVLVAAMKAAAQAYRSVHLMGLLSDAGVHSSLKHVHALIELAKNQGVQNLFVHCFMDGRDTSPTAGAGYLRGLAGFLEDQGLGRLGTMVGRYYAMDRDKRWRRVELAYNALVHCEGIHADDVDSAILRSYEEGVTDEFILPTILDESPDARIKDGDSVIFFNFRPDRARELTRALVDRDFKAFERGASPAIHFVAMTEYEASLSVPIAFPDVEPTHVLAEILGGAGLTQLHTAETEKYAHVTFFFNGGREEPFPGELRRLIPSPTDVDTYDQKPEMSAYEVAARFRETLAKNRVDFVVLNFANPDMVGHTGNLPATIRAIEDVDNCLRDVVEALWERDADVFITSDHGNAEYMINPDGSPNTAHTTNRVPLLFLREGTVLREDAGLSDLAPTFLRLLGLPIPDEMTGKPLF